ARVDGPGGKRVPGPPPAGGRPVLCPGPQRDTRSRRSRLRTPGGALRARGGTLRYRAGRDRCRRRARRPPPHAHGAVRRAGHRVRRTHARVAAGTAAERRRVGAALVRLGVAVHRVRAPAPAAGAVPGAPAGDRGGAALLRAAVVASPSCEGTLMVGSQGFVPDPRNERVKIWLDGALVPRSEAKVSVFDAGFVLGDGVWEGLRLVNGRLAFLDRHLDRLFAGARALSIDLHLGRAALTRALYDTVRANGMTDGVHVRLMVTRGLKLTPNQDPRATVGQPTVVIVAEYKEPDPAARERGLTLITSTYRTSTPDVFDMHLNTHSRLNLIQALVQAANLGADEALMLDPRGFVASCNATNFFVVHGDVVVTSTGRYCFKGITRGQVVELCRENGIGI